MDIKQNTEYKGFFLADTATLCDGISILTGLNGSGKTRLLEAISNNKITAHKNAAYIDQQKIKLILQKDMEPYLGAHSSKNEIDTEANYAWEAYIDLIDIRSSEKIDDAALLIKYRALPKNNPRIQTSTIIKMIDTILKEKNNSSIQREDIYLIYNESAQLNFGYQNLGKIFFSYIRKKEQNEFNEWLHKSKGKNVLYYTQDKFIEKFGQPPWHEFDHMLDKAFKGKFKIIPPTDDQQYEYTARIVDGKYQSIINHSEFSSGEKSIFWLTLTLMNCRWNNFYDVTSSAPDLILLDEPDAFLHPKMVQQMFDVFDEFHKKYGTSIVLTTHSPTTVALAPEGSVFLVENNTVCKIEKDAAISNLLDGISYISVKPENRRQVYVESAEDAKIFESLFSHLKSKNCLIDSKISASFIPSGPKMHEQHIKDQINKHFSKNSHADFDVKVIENFIAELNGNGCSSQVIEIVRKLTEEGATSVRGIIDYDNKNHAHSSNIVILGNNYSYAIENIIYDPACLMLLLNQDHPKKYTKQEISPTKNNEQLHKNQDAIQEMTDFFLQKLLGHNNKDATIEYSGGINAKTDKRYLEKQCKDMKDEVINKFSELKSYKQQLMENIVEKIMINMSNGELIPKKIIDVFLEIQQ